MKLCRYGKAGYEKPGVIDSEGRLRDLKVVDNIGPNEISPRGLKMLTRIKPETPPVSSNPRLGVPYVGVGKFVAIGLNYRPRKRRACRSPRADRVHEGHHLHQRPGDDVIQPKNSTKLDWEVELGVVIGTQAKYVNEADALNVAGYCVVNDVSRAPSSWRPRSGTRARASTPRADRPVARHDRRDPGPAGARHVARRERQRMQTGNTRTMVFSVAKIISHVSHYMTLLPGDIIATGTPPSRPRHEADPGLPQARGCHDLGNPGPRQCP